jgi:hypothetical protein
MASRAGPRLPRPMASASSATRRARAASGTSRGIEATAPRRPRLAAHAVLQPHGRRDAEHREVERRAARLP